MARSVRILAVMALVVSGFVAVRIDTAEAAKRCGGQVPTIVGTNGPDRLRGTPGPDVIDGLGGNDVIIARGGNDIVCGRGGNDDLRGGGGDDVLLGGRGNDKLKGQGGFDTCGIHNKKPRPSRFAGARTSADIAKKCELEDAGIRKQSVFFSGHTFAIERVAASTESRFSFGRTDRAPSFGNERRIFVDLRVTNHLTTTPLSGLRNLIRLRLRNGSLVAPDQLLVRAGPGTTENYTVSYKVPKKEIVSNVALLFGSDAVEQTVLPVMAPVKAERFPFDAGVSAAAAAAVMGPCNNPVTVQVLGARWDLEMGDLRPQGGNNAKEWTYRAPAGNRLLLVDFRIAGQVDACGGTNVQSSAFRIDIDGAPRATWTFVNDIVRAGEVIDFTMAYHVPVDSSSVTLLTGKFGQTIASTVVALPNLAR